jgi:hypothetical protein
MTLRSRLLDRDESVLVYGTTPPRHSASEEAIQTAALRLAERVSPLRPDGLVVYDVQDESSRTNAPRPFPFLPTSDSRAYASRLSQLTGLPAITYRCVAGMSDGGWEEWLTEAGQTYRLHCVVPVGAPASRGAPPQLPLSQAIRAAVAHPGEFLVGGVAIAERHSTARSESQRMLQKARDGCCFFVSQGVYHSEPTLRMLQDYGRDCREAGIAARRVVLTFTPCGQPRTMEFLKWLGIAVPASTEQAILSAPSPLARSIETCCATLRAILDQNDPAVVPLGVNVESVSIRKDEIDASVDLFQALREVAAEYR